MGMVHIQGGRVHSTLPPLFFGSETKVLGSGRSQEKKIGVADTRKYGFPGCEPADPQVSLRKNEPMVKEKTLMCGSPHGIEQREDCPASLIVSPLEDFVFV